MTAAITRRHVERLNACNAELLRYLRELVAQRRRREFYVVEGNQQ